MNEDPEEVTFHISLIAAQLRGLKITTTNLNESIERYTLYPLVSLFAGICGSLAAYPHLGPAAADLALQVGALAVAEERPGAWQKIDKAYDVLLKLVQSPIPAWVKKRVALVDAQPTKN